jgi:hypothetical protein
MSILYSDILYPIFEELQYDKESLASCLRVNKTWCEIVVPILWRNPWEYLTHEKKELLLNVIISHLTDEAKYRLKQHFSSSTNSYKKPLFNYISFCKHLDLEMIYGMINTQNNPYMVIKNDILELFINKNAEYTHLNLGDYYDYHLIPDCFSKIKFLRCEGRVHDNNLALLTKVCKSIKELQLYLYKSGNNYGFVKLIENQESLLSISFLNRYSPNDSLFCKNIENSLIKHANTIEYLYICGQLETQILTSFVNLKTLVLHSNWLDSYRWDCIEDVYLPSLQTLYSYTINIESLKILLKNSGEKLTKIEIYNSIKFLDVVSNKEIIQAIYQNCPNLMYLELFYKDTNILELEKLLINCQYLKSLKLYIFFEEQYIDWDNLLSILATYSPPSLFEFIFYCPIDKPKLESLKLFFDNWEGRHPMSLIISTNGNFTNKNQLNYLISSYKAKGVIKEFVHDYHEDDQIWSKGKAKRVVKDLKTKAASIFNGFKKIFN